MFNRIRRVKENFLFSANVLFNKNLYFIYTKNEMMHHRLCFSQEGEDMILSRLFEGKKKKGFYVDVGAHHPQRFSNTYRFYLNGWRGINIDPLPEGMDTFREIRPRDINLEYAISDGEDELTYFEFNETALNGFSPELAEERDGLQNYRVVNKRKIKTHRLADILDKYLPNDQEIDFLNVDVEGLDLRVLQSNDWKKYRPFVVLAEDLPGLALNSAEATPIVDYMVSQGYELKAMSVNTLIFCRND